MLDALHRVSLRRPGRSRAAGSTSPTAVAEPRVFPVFEIYDDQEPSRRAAPRSTSRRCHARHGRPAAREPRASRLRNDRRLTPARPCQRSVNAGVLVTSNNLSLGLVTAGLRCRCLAWRVVRSAPSDRCEPRQRRMRDEAGAHVDHGRSPGEARPVEGRGDLRSGGHVLAVAAERAGDGVVRFPRAPCRGRTRRAAGRSGSRPTRRCRGSPSRDRPGGGGIELAEGEAEGAVAREEHDRPARVRGLQGQRVGQPEAEVRHAGIVEARARLVRRREVVAPEGRVPAVVDDERVVGQPRADRLGDDRRVDSCAAPRRPRTAARGAR